MSVTLKEHIQTLISQTDCKETTAVFERVLSLFDVIAHGEQGHRDWLEQAIESHFLGLPMPDYVAK